MNKISNNLIVLGLIIIGILALSVVVAFPAKTNAYADYGQYVVRSDAPLPQRHPIPIIFSISPKTIETGQGSQIIEISGSGFVYDSVAKFDGYDRPTSFVSSTKLLMRLSQTDVNQLGDHLITVENPAPGGGLSHPKVFEVRNPKGVSGDLSDVRYQDSNRNYYDDDAYFYRDQNNFGRNLGASAIDSNGFFPSTFLQWLALAILILLIVVIWRRLYKKKEEEKPLKHH